MFLSTSTLSGYDFDQVLDIAELSGCQGIELQISNKFHVSLSEALENGHYIRRAVQARTLELGVLNSFVAIEDTYQVNQLLYAAHLLQAPQVRLLLPQAAHASVAKQARVNQSVPAYRSHYKPSEIIDRLRYCLKNLEAKAERAGVRFLLELHWGTIMSSFTSAYLLVKDLNPQWIGVTFDPANMLVEGREDWEFGLGLLGKYIANVHIKNVVWTPSPEGWTWSWVPHDQGMLDWSSLTSLLKQNSYKGNYAIEDFLIPSGCANKAVDYIKNVRKTLQIKEPDGSDHDDSDREIRQNNSTRSLLLS